MLAVGACEDSARANFLITSVDPAAGVVCLDDVDAPQNPDLCHPIAAADLQALKVGDCIKATTDSSLTPKRPISDIKLLNTTACK